MKKSTIKFLRKLKQWLPKTRRQQFVFLVVAVFLVGILAITAIRIIRGSQFEQNFPANKEITNSTDTPDESEDNAKSYKWFGGDSDPKRIKINQIGVDSLIQRMGVDQDNKIAVPTNVHLAGWFTQSEEPGQKGLSIIAAHVSGRTTDGLFKNLGQLTKGDEIEVELGDGSLLKYRVISTTSVPEAQSASILFSQNPKVVSQLNLITCGGNFDVSSNQYSDRVIVFAELIT